MNRQFRLWRDKGERFFGKFARLSSRILFQKSTNLFWDFRMSLVGSDSAARAAASESAPAAQQEQRMESNGRQQRPPGAERDGVSLNLDASDGAGACGRTVLLCRFHFVERSCRLPPVDQVGSQNTLKGRERRGIRGPFPSSAAGGMLLTILKMGMKDIKKTNNQAVSRTKTS